jgi:tight adherence protein B
MRKNGLPPRSMLWKRNRREDSVMFGLDINLLAIIVLAAISAGAVCYALLYANIEADKNARSRVKKIKSAETDTSKVKAARDRVNEVSKRKKSVQDTLKELENKQVEREKKSSPGLKTKLQQAGITISVSQFFLISALVGAMFFFVFFMLGLPIYIALVVLLVTGLGLPRLVVNYIWKKRLAKFIDEFPNALEVIVRSIKSGLPLNDAMRLIASDGQEPVKGEFRKIIEAQQLGMGIPEACSRMYNSVPLQEVSFFAIVIGIQSQAGGNLSEALGNLSRVLRDRKKMKAKIAALSMEAKASAAIIGALPFIVGSLVYMTSPHYMMILFTDTRGHIILGFSAVWMSLGLIVMKNMTSFEI